MADAVRRLDYRFRATLDDLDDWLATKGIKRRNRFRIYKENLQKLDELLERKSPEQVHDDLFRTGRLTEILSTLVETIEITENWPVLRASQVDIPNQLLETALSGPADAFRENETSNKGRNAMFELSVGATLARAGLNPTFCTPNPDISFEMENLRIKVECKRLLSEEKLFPRIKEAINQLSKSVRADSSDVGIVAVSVSRLFNPGDRVAFAKNGESPHAILNRTLDLTLRKNEKKLGSLAKPWVSAVFFYLSSPFYVPNMGYTCQTCGVLFPMSCTEQPFLRRLADAMKL